MLKISLTSLSVLHAQLPPVNGFEPGDCLIIARDITLCSFGGGIESVGSQKVVWVRLRQPRWLKNPPGIHLSLLP